MFTSDTRAFLLDLNGVFYQDNTILPGAVRVISELKSRKIPVRFVTNTSTLSRSDLSINLQKLGLSIEPVEIINPIQVAILYLQKCGYKSVHPVVADSVKSEFKAFKTDHTNPDAIIVGDIGERWNYQIMNKLFGMMVYGAELVALHRGRFWQVGTDLRLDIGAFVAGLEYAAGKEAIVIGKPSPSFFQMAISDLGVPAAQTAMIGDDIDSDVGGAQKCGLKGILVKTGKYRPELVARSGIKPDGILENVAELLENI